MSTEISINNLSKYFSLNWTSGAIKQKSLGDSKQKVKVALNHINLNCKAGDIIGLIGENGAGKSTLLSILAGVSQQSEGSVEIQGKVTAVLTLGVGLREDLTGRENIYLDGEIQGKSHAEIKKIIDDIIEFSELGDFIDKPVKTYSTGMKSRLSFSMLINIDPEILLIDEALSAGDVFFAKKASKKIKELCQKGKIVIIVSHSLATINSFCNRCIWLNKGQVKMDGKPEKITKEYLNHVKQEDEKKEKSQHKKEWIPISKQINYEIKELKLINKNHINSANLFYTFEPMAIELGILKRKKIKSASLIVSIERIDGIIVDYKTYDIQNDSQSCDNALIQYHFTLDTLILYKGFFQLTVEILEEDHISNRFIDFFEVKTTNTIMGGEPLLQYPIEVTTIHQETETCSDLTEMT